MKTTFQIHRLFANISFRSQEDWEMVQAFCQKRHHRIGTFSPTLSEDGITSSRFSYWYTDGYGAGDFAILRDIPVIVKDSQLDHIRLCGRFDGSYSDLDLEVTESDLRYLPATESAMIEEEMSKVGLEYSRSDLKVSQKYVPAVNDRVTFWNGDISGLGVIREILTDGSVELYCYFIYETKEIGWSMHEKGIVNLHGFHFEPMNIIGQRRLMRELEKHGVTWYDKLHRVEPLQVKVEKGASYWYISDKMKVVQDVEKGTPTSNFRYIAGNYFASQEDAIDMLGKFADLLKDRLAGM